MEITRFEDIVAWKEAKIVVQMVYNAINNSEKVQKTL